MSGTQARRRRAADARPAEVRVTVRLTPRAGHDGIDGVVDGVVHARVAAPPVDGAANEALVRLIAAELAVAPSSVRLVAGGTGRVKVVAIEGVAPERIRDRWPGLRGREPSR